jgi:hypothetical protein
MARKRSLMSGGSTARGRAAGAGGFATTRAATGRT